MDKWWNLDFWFDLIWLFIGIVVEAERIRRKWEGFSNLCSLPDELFDEGKGERRQLDIWFDDNKAVKFNLIKVYNWTQL